MCHPSARTAHEQAAQREDVRHQKASGERSVREVPNQRQRGAHARVINDDE
jgi:hypothetical protein|tara:strand:- start:297 stop:449 length:153 start_codon:yes stop_codon:yes gene_type:complete